MAGGTTTEKTQSQSVNQIPAWVTNAGEQNYGFAQDVASRPLQQYQGQMVAGISPQTQQAWNLAASSGNVGQDQYGGSQAGFLNSLGQTPMSVSAGQLSNTDLSPYIIPILSPSSTRLYRFTNNNLANNRLATRNQANAANAFGGSRMGVQQGVTQAQGAQGMAQMAQQLNAANFGQAQAAAQQDISGRLTAQGMNQKAQQDKINSDILASQGLANLGDSQSRTNAANFTMLTQAGASQAQQAQNIINSMIAKFGEAKNYPNQQLATLLSALGMTPHDTATTGSETKETTTPPNWGALALGGLEDLSGFFKPTSDRESKTDITKLSKDRKTGLPMYSFRYKGDPKTYPKVVGPMAQDVEKQYPGATQRTGGKLTVDPSIMRAAGVRGYEDGTSDVQPSPWSNIAGGINKFLSGGHLAKAMGEQGTPQTFQTSQMPQGWGAPSMGYLVSGFSSGIAKVPSTPKVPGALAMGSDTVPALLTPGEAVLNQQAATKLGRGTIKQLNAGIPLSSFMPTKAAIGQAVTAPRAGAKALHGLSNTKLRAPIKGALA